MNIKSCLQQAAQKLAVFAAPYLEAEVLLMFVLAVKRAYLYSQLDLELTPNQITQFEQLLKRRQAGEPIAYITKSREFWGIDFKVTPATLIPRPETELLVELCLICLSGMDFAKIVDLGTGCGAIALALAKERPSWQIVAVDSSVSALQVMRENCIRTGAEHVQTMLGHWCEPLASRDFDAIVCNPPYIAENDEHLKIGDLRFEPRSALSAADDGLADIRSICAQAQHYLRAGGYLLLEHGYQQSDAVIEIMREFAYDNINSHCDLAALPRVVVGQKL